jgi:hypothetical protein
MSAATLHPKQIVALRTLASVKGPLRLTAFELMAGERIAAVSIDHLVGHGLAEGTLRHGWSATPFGREVARKYASGEYPAIRP